MYRKLILFIFLGGALPCSSFFQNLLYIDNHVAEMVLAQKLADQELGLLYYICPKDFYIQEINRMYKNIQACKTIGGIMKYGIDTGSCSYCEQLPTKIYLTLGQLGKDDAEHARKTAEYIEKACVDARKNAASWNR
jgi:hypothetical protein